MNGPLQKPGALIGVTTSVLGALGGGVLVSPWVASSAMDVDMICVFAVDFSAEKCLITHIIRNVSVIQPAHIQI